MDVLGDRPMGVSASVRRSGARTAGTVPSRRIMHAGPQAALDWGGQAPQRAQALVALVDAVSEGIVLLDAKQRIVLLNPAAQRVFGSQPGPLAAALAGQPFEVLLSPQADATPLHGPGDEPTTATHACLGRRADGTTFRLQLSLARLPEEPGLDRGAGPQPCWAVFVRELGADTAAGREWQALQQRLRSVVELAPIAIWIADGEHLSFANRAAARLAGAESAAALVGQSVFDLLRLEGHPELRRQLARTLAQDGEPGTLQARLVRMNGDTREVEIALAALPQHGPQAVQMVVSDVSQRNREVRALERSRQALKRLSANAVEAREEERRRIARELHDELGQSLSALKMEIADCADIDNLSTEHPRVSLILARLDDIMNSVRRIAADLRPLMLDDLGLGDAIESLAHDFARRMGVQVHLHVEHIEPPAGEQVAIALYRMVQEALTNVARHAHATQVHIDLCRQDDELVLSVRDDGIGLPGLPPHRDSQYGLLGMQERADMLGGRLELDNLPDGGARVRVRVPLRRPVPAPSAMGLLAALTAAAQAHGGAAAAAVASPELRDVRDHRDQPRGA